MQSIKYVYVPLLDIAGANVFTVVGDRNISSPSPTTLPYARSGVEFNADRPPLCRDFGNQISENVQKHTSQASKEANKSTSTAQRFLSPTGLHL